MDLTYPNKERHQKVTQTMSLQAIQLFPQLPVERLLARMAYEK